MDAASVKVHVWVQPPQHALFSMCISNKQINEKKNTPAKPKIYNGYMQKLRHIKKEWKKSQLHETKNDEKIFQ